MKNLFFSFLTLFFFCSTSQAQEKTFSDLCNLTINDFRLMYDQLGDLHNEGLEKAYFSLKELKKFNDLKQVDSDLIYDIVFQNMDYYTPGDENKTIFYKDHKKLFSKSELSQEFQSAIIDIEKLLSNVWNQSNSGSQFDGVFEKHVTEISDCVEKLSFTSMVSVAKGSSYYWKNNSEKWSDLLNTGTPSARKIGDGDLINIANSDAVGAAGGALSGAYIGATGGTVLIPGIGTAAGAAGGVIVGTISGAISSSVLSAVFAWLS